MKIIVIADIHSNYHALNKIKEIIIEQKIDYLLILGDIVTDLPYPSKTIAIITELEKITNVITIKGNREEYLENLDTSKPVTSLNGSLLYTKNNLTLTELDYLKSLPYEAYLEIPNYPEIVMRHATKNNTRELLFDNLKVTNQYIRSCTQKYILCGHNHQSSIYQYDNKYLINPGSLGIFNENSQQSTYALLSTNGNLEFDVSIIRFDYDYQLVIKDIIDSGLLDIGLTYSQTILDSFLFKKQYSSKVIELGLLRSENPTEEDFKQAYLELSSLWNK